jgi:hypothetical protein
MNKLFLIIISSLLAGCAVTYNKIDLSKTAFQTVDSTSKVKISASYTNALAESGNNFIRKKSNRKNITIIPISINNYSLDTLRIEKKDIEIFINYEPVEIISPEKYYKKLKQNTGWHTIEIVPGAYANFGVVAALIVTPTIPTSAFILSLLTPLGVYNVITATKANKQMYKNFNELDIIGKPIAPQTHFNGIICVNTTELTNLLIRINNK